jgi:hypothetical protein
MLLYYYDINGNPIKSRFAWHSNNFDESYEKVQALKRREMQYSTDDYLFLFGKYKDRLLSTMTNEIELSYVKWFYENVAGLGYHATYSGLWTFQTSSKETKETLESFLFKLEA